LADVLHAVVDYERSRRTSDHEARSGSGVEEVIDWLRCHRYSSVERGIPVNVDAFFKSTGSVERVFCACTSGVTQRQFSGV
jgi:hypothetical protein